jgi:hypothetical protein
MSGMPTSFDDVTPTREELLSSPGGALYLRSWLANRFVVGLLGVLMPIVLILGEKLFFEGLAFPRASLSAYCFSGLGAVFVGTLCVTGVFLITYMCFHRNLDNRITTAAGVFAILVAVVPTWPDHEESPTLLQVKLGRTLDQTVHSAAAFAFIALLAWMSWRFADREGARSNRTLARVHRGCTAVMVVSAAAAAILGFGFHVTRVGPFSGLLLVELACTYAFGVSWLVKGLEISRSLVRRGFYGEEARRSIGETENLSARLTPAPQDAR